jgi:hypothetical protein
MKTLHIVAFILLIAGGLNWLLFGVFQWEIGMLLGGSSALLSRAIYVLVGLAAVYELVTHKGSCRACDDAASSTSTSSMPA